MTPAQFKKEIKKLDFEKRNDIHELLEKAYWALRDVKILLEKTSLENATLLEIKPELSLRSHIYHLQKEICHERYID